MRVEVDGQVYDVPDDATVDEIDALTRPAAARAPQLPNVGTAKSFGRGITQGATLGFGDELEGLIQAALPVSGDAPSFFERYRKAREGARRENVAAQQAHGTAYLGGNIAGGLLPAVAASVAAPAGVASRIAQGVGFGGAAGAGTSTAEDLGGLASDVGVGAALGGALAGTGEVAGKVLKKAAQAIGQKFLSNTAGRIAARKALSPEAVEAGYETGAIRPWRTIQGAADRLEAARDAIGLKIGNVLREAEKAGVQAPDAVNLASELEAVGNAIKSKSFNAAHYEPYLRVASDLVDKAAAKGGNISLTEAEALKSSLQGLAKQAYKALPGTTPSGTAQAYEGIAQRFRSATERALESQKSLAPQAAEAFVPLKQQYGPLNEAFQRAAEGAARAHGRGWIGLPEAAMLAAEGVPAAAAMKAGRLFLPQTLGYLAWKAANTPTGAGTQTALRSALLKEALKREMPRLRLATVPAEEEEK